MKIRSRSGLAILIAFAMLFSGVQPGLTAVSASEEGTQQETQQEAPEAGAGAKTAAVAEPAQESPGTGAALVPVPVSDGAGAEKPAEKDSEKAEDGKKADDAKTTEDAEKTEDEEKADDADAAGDAGKASEADKAGDAGKADDADAADNAAEAPAAGEDGQNIPAVAEEPQEEPAPAADADGSDMETGEDPRNEDAEAGAEDEAESDETEEEAKMPAQTLQARNDAGLEVQVQTQEGALPEGASIQLGGISAEECLSIAKGAYENIAGYVGIRIFYFDKDGSRIAPAAGSVLHISVKLPDHAPLPTPDQADDPYHVIFRAEDGRSVEPANCVVNAQGAQFDVDRDTDYILTAVGTFEEDETVLTAVVPEKNVSITMTIPKASLPCPAGELSLSAGVVAQQEAVEMVEEKMDDAEDTARETILFDIKLMRGEEEVEPAGPVSVVFSGLEIPNEDAQVFHVDDAADTVEEMPAGTNGEGEVVMETDHFSVYAVTYTVESYIRSYTGETFRITVSFDDAAEIPIGAELAVREILPETAEYESYLKESEEALREETIDPFSLARFFDIEILNNGEKVEPKANVSVRMELADLPDTEENKLNIVHFADGGPVTVDSEITETEDILFEAESFSVWAAITVQLPQSADDLDGWSVTIDRNGRFVTSAVNYNAGSPFRLGKSYNSSDAAVWTFERSGEGYGYTFYNISTTVNGEKRYLYMGHVWNDHNAAHTTLEPQPQNFAVEKNNDGTYTVFIVLTDDWSRYNLNEWGGQGGNGFAGYINNPNWSNPDEHMNFTFRNKQPVLQNGRNYAVIVKDEDNNKYYAVQSDGKLVEVEYDEREGKAGVLLEDPFTWTYTSAHDGLSDDTLNFNPGEAHPDWEPFNIRAPYDARGLNQGTKLKEGDYYRYLSPASGSGMAQEDASAPSHHNAKWANAVRYENNNVHGVIWNGSGFDNTGSYIGADFGNMTITGNVDAANAATVFLAEVENVPGTGADNETVSHIDIGIIGKGHLKVPLAYGKYYDENGNMVLEVSPFGEDVTLELSQDVDITRKDIMDAVVKAYNADGEELDDAFYITGYSANEHTGHSNVQVRMEGSFKVSTLGPYNGWYNRSNDDMERRAARLENQVYYEIATEKEVTFDLVYEGTKLYDLKGNPLTVSGIMPINARFSYWSDKNECPILQEDFEENYDFLIPAGDDTCYAGRNNENWKSGAIIDNNFDIRYIHNDPPFNFPPYPGDSGMDFILEVDGEIDSRILAFELVKTIEDTEGNVIHPAENVTNTFNVYCLEGANEDPEIVAGVGNGYAVPPDTVDDPGDKQTGGYTAIPESPIEIIVGSEGADTYYDYDVTEGMYYAEEDPAPMAKGGANYEIVDTGGLEWIYDSTRVETEYVWRNDAYTNKRHVANGFSGVPDVLGFYEFAGWEDIQETMPRNGFLEFYVYNVYKPKTTSLTVRKVWLDRENDERPQSLTVNLLADGEPALDGEENPIVVTLNSGNDWTATVENLPKHADGKTIEYKWEEVVPDGYVLADETSVTADEENVTTTITTLTNILPPEKKETAPYEGAGVLGNVRVGDQITYEISYCNYKKDKAAVTVRDKLDPNVRFVSATDNGSEADGVVTWTLEDVDPDTEGTVEVTVEVLKGALKSSGGTGNVINEGDTVTVQVGNDPAFTLNTVENPLPEKKETAPYEGTGVLGPVKAGDIITYEINYRNYSSEAADVTIKDKLDPNVELEYASEEDSYVYDDHTVTWTLKDVPAGKEGVVILKVRVLESAQKSSKGPGKVINEGDTVTVQVGNDEEFTLNTVENPVSEAHKKEKTPYEGAGVLGKVKVGDEIEYEIDYHNYKNVAADVVIRDRLDPNVEFVSATDGGTAADGVVTWTLAKVTAGKKGTVTLKVKVLEGALMSKDGPGKVVNGGETATVKVGNDKELSLESVENPVEDPKQPHKKEITPYEGIGTLGEVKAGDTIIYEISYKNYMTEAADVIVRDKLDPNVRFITASTNKWTEQSGIVTWKLEDVPAGEEGTVTVTVKVKEDALESEGGPGKVVNGGDTTTVKVGDGPEYAVEYVENPVKKEPDKPEEPVSPHKKEIAPYNGTGKLGDVNVGDEITYSISFRNYKSEAADVVITDKLDPNVRFMGASNGGTEAGGVVTWTLKDIPAGKVGAVVLKVKVLEGALQSGKGPGKVVNGGDTTTVKIGNDKEMSVEYVENPVKGPGGPGGAAPPKTGDTTNVVPYIVLLAAAAAVLLAVLTAMKKRKNG